MLGDGLPGEPLVGGHAGGLRTSQMSSRWCGTPRRCAAAELGRADIHARVQLHRVGVDHLAAQRQGQAQRQLGLPGRGRPDDGDHTFWHGSVRPRFLPGGDQVRDAVGAGHAAQPAAHPRASRPRPPAPATRRGPPPSAHRRARGPAGRASGRPRRRAPRLPRRRSPARRGSGAPSVSRARRADASPMASRATRGARSAIAAPSLRQSSADARWSTACSSTCGPLPPALPPRRRSRPGRAATGRR